MPQGRFSVADLDAPSAPTTGRFSLDDLDDAAPPVDRSQWDRRADGSEKGNGFLGVLPRPDGSVSTEISVGVTINGKEVEIPTLVPTLSPDERDWLINNDVSDPSRIPKPIIQKAVDFARTRIAAGKSPFAGPDESPQAQRQPPVQVDRQYTSDVRVTPPAPPVGPVTGPHPEARMSAAPPPVAPPALPPPSTRLGSAKTGGMATTGPTIVGEGLEQIAHGVREGSKYYSQPTDDTLNAASDVLEGAAKAATPLAIAGAIVDLPGTVVTLGASYVAAAAAGKAAEFANASPAAQRFARAFAGTAAALGLGGRQVQNLQGRARQILADAHAVAEQARAFDAAHPPEPEPGIVDVTPRNRGRLTTGTRALPPGPPDAAGAVPTAPTPPPSAPPAPPSIDLNAAIRDLAAAQPNSPEALTALAALQHAGLSLADIDTHVQAATPPSAPPAGDDLRAVGDAGSAIVDNMYRSFLERLQAGKAPEPFPQQSLAAQIVQRAYNEGLVTTIDDAKRFASMSKDEATAFFRQRQGQPPAAAPQGAFSVGDIDRPALTDEGGRSLGERAYAGPERRRDEQGPPAGVERRLLPREQVLEDLRQNPDVVRQAEAMRARAAATRHPEPAEEHEFASTQINLPPAVGAQLQAMADRIPAEDLTPDGRETQPHVTVKFGLHGNDPEKVRALLADEPPIRVTFGKTSIFPNGESDAGDVVKVDVDSPDLHRLNQKIADALPHTDTHPEYTPHATVAYVKPGRGATYAGDATLEGQTVTIDHVVFSGKHGEQIPIPLTGVRTGDAVSEQGGDALDVREQTGHGEAVGGGDAAPAAPAGAGAPAAGAAPAARIAGRPVETLTDRELHAIIDRPQTPEPDAHAAVAELMTREEAAATATNPESRYAEDDVTSLMAATEQEQRGRLDEIRAGEAWLDTQPANARNGAMARNRRKHIDKLRLEYLGAYSELVDAVGSEHTDALRARVEGRKVGGESHAAAVPSSDRAPLAGAPPAHGEEPGSEGPLAQSDRVRGGPDGGRGERPDSERRAPDAGAGPDATGVGVPPERGGRPDAPAGSRPRAVAPTGPADFRITDATELAVGGDKTRVTNNLAAVETLKRLEAEQRPATPDEQATLAKYVGWGGLSSAFKETHPDNARLRAALTDAEYRSARASTPNAHYTSPVVITAVYDALARLGVRGPLRVLEPAAGVGHFLGLMPEALAAQASRTAVEMDSLSGRITAALYPQARVLVKPFQDATLAKDHYDLVVGNPPFGNYQVFDKTFKGRPKDLTSSIHNYFFAKALDLARPGGVVAFITSHYTMDAQEPIVREYLASKADLLGAIRLPYAAFKQNAGTEVVTDIIFLQKRAPGTRAEGQLWLASKPQAYPDKRGAQVTQHVNEYYLAHPEMVLGTSTSTGKMNQRDDAYNVVPPGEQDAERVAHWQAHAAAQLRGAVAELPEQAYTPPTTKAATPTLEQQLPSAAAPPDVREHALYVVDGRVYEKEHGVGVPLKLEPPQIARVKGLLKVRDAVRGTMRAMLDPETTEADVRKAQRALNAAYDAFVDRHGYIAKRTNYKALREDPDVFTLLALEEWAPKATRPEKAAIFTKRTLRPHTPVTHVDTPKEALLVSLNETSRVDWPRMAALTGQSEHELQLALEGLVFHDPASRTWEHADRYLSGNVKAKLQAARAGGQPYALNVQALEAVQPPDLEPQDIAVRLGAPWVPANVIDAFAAHLGLHGLTFTYSAILSKWAKHDGRFYGGGSVQNREQWGTARKSAVDLLHTALNLGEIVVTDRVTRPDGSEGTVVNQPETIAAREKAQAQADEFKEWIWSDATRAARLARIYNDTMNTMRLWEPDGSHLSLPGMSAGVTLRAHQKNFIWRGLQQPNALAHHVVGAGKTFAGIALALEKRRMGLARKPMVVVPNHLPQQWARDVLKLYPAARVLASQKSDFDPKNRKRFLSRIATGDWDVVIVPYSHYGLIKTSDETFNDYLTQEIDALEQELKRARQEGGKNDPTVKELEKAKLNLQAKLRGLKDDQKKDDTVTFEELGVDMLIVDEAHNFKRLFFPTKMTRVAGVPSGKGSQRAFDLFVKSRYLAQANPTGGTVFLTGTPISNTMAEMFVLMRYLAQPMLNQRGIPQFDGWAATFGEKVTAFEISPTGRGFRSKTRFARFTNMPELMQMYRSFADVQTADMLKLPTPKLKGGKAILHTIPASTELNAYVETLLERYEAVLGKNGKQKPDPRIDNPLKITTDGRKAALDLRLVGEHQPEGGKIDESGQTIVDIWRRESHRKGTQLVFADLGAPNDKKDSDKFTVYDALKAKLVELGIPREQIAFIHDPKTDAQKQALFESVRAGDVRVLLGSTEKMGAGTNVQDRLVAEHHLDAPWRPSDIEQREGRILRQGNLFGDAELKSPEYDPSFEVEIHTYLSERSFDAYLWQLLESKARFITQAVKGDSTSREIDDADDIVISFGAAKAVATGNPAIMEHAKAQSDVARLEVSEANYGKRKWRLQKALAELPEQIEGWEQKERDARALVDAIRLPTERKDLTLTVNGKTLAGDDAVAAVQAALDKARSADRRVQVSKFYSDTEAIPVGTAAGVDVRVFLSFSFLMEPMTVTQHWQIATGDATLSKSATIGSGAMQSLYTLLETEPQRALDKATRELTTLRSSLEAAQKEVDKPFAQAGTIKALREKIKTLEAALNLDAASLQKEAAAAGSIVTTAEEDAADAKAEAAQAAAEEDGGDVPDVAAPDDSQTPPPTKRGTTLQSTILPGAAEFGEYVLEPALRAIAAGVRENHADIVGLFAPGSATPHAVVAAGALRANRAAAEQRQQRARRAVRTVEKMMDAWTHAQSQRFWDVMEGLEAPDTLDPDTRAIAATYRQILDTYTAAIRKRSLIRSYIQDYWGHEWQRGGSTVEQAVRRLFGRRPIQGPESFRKRRSIPTMRDGLEIGLEPLSWNPTTQLLRKLHEMNKSIAWDDAKREMKATGQIKFVAAGKRLPDGWQRLPDSLGIVYGPSTFTSITGEETRIPFGKLVAGYYAAPAEVVRLLTNYMSPGLRQKSALFNLYRTVGNFLNQLQLSFSAFHMMTTGMESVVSKQSLVFEQLARGQFVPALRAQAQVPIAPMLDVFRGHKALKAFYAHDANAAALDDMVGQIVNAGGGFGWDLFEHENAPEAFMRNLRAAGGAARAGEVGRAMGQVAAAGLRTIPALVELTAKPIMEGWVPRLKIAAFLDLAKMELETLGPAPDLEEARRVLGAAWDSIDNRFGELRYDNLFWHNALKDLGMASVRALGWNIGTVREMFGAPAAQLRQAGLTPASAGGGGRGKPPMRFVHTGTGPGGHPHYEYQPESRLHRKTAWFLSMVLVYGLAGAIYMYLKTGKRPASLKDYFFPQNGEVDRNGRPVRVSIPGYFKDLYAVTRALPGSAIETASHKLHPLLTLLADILTNEDFYGTEIRNPDDPFVAQVADVMRFAVKTSAPISTTQAGVDAKLGVTRAPATVTRTPLEQYLHDIAPPMRQTQAQAEQAAERRNLRAAVRAVPPGGARAPVDTSHLSARSVKETLRTARRSSLTFAMQRATFPQALKAYEIATPEERAEIRTALIRKVPPALASTPPAERAALMTRYRAVLQLPVAAAAAGF